MNSPGKIVDFRVFDQCKGIKFRIFITFSDAGPFKLKVKICNSDSKNKEKIAKNSKLQIHTEFEPL